MNCSKKRKIALGTLTFLSAAVLAINVKADTSEETDTNITVSQTTLSSGTENSTSQTVSNNTTSESTATINTTQTSGSSTEITNNTTSSSGETVPSPIQTGSAANTSASSPKTTTPNTDGGKSKAGTTEKAKVPVKKPIIYTKEVVLPTQKSKPVSAMATRVKSNAPVTISQASIVSQDLNSSGKIVAVNDGKVAYTGPTLEKIAAVPLIQKIDNTTSENFIKSIAPSVQIIAGKNNLYASIIIAQAILESGYGQSEICTTDFNIFNITGSYLGNSVSLQTLEYDSSGNPYYTTQNFRVYSNYNQSLNDYINLMIKGTSWNKEIYAGAWKTNAKTYQEAAQALQGVFATDPDYAQKLITIIQEYHLNQYDNVGTSTKVVGDKIPASPTLSAMDTDMQFPAYNGVEYPGASSYAFGNCTQYVYNRIMQLGGYVGQQMGNGGEWGINAAKQGYFTTSVPTMGYAVSFPPGVAGSSPIYGHVAFVEKVYSDGSILVSEMNVKGLDVVSYRHISAGIAALATYIQPK